LAPAHSESGDSADTRRRTNPKSGAWISLQEETTMRFRVHNSALAREEAKKDLLVARTCKFLAKDLPFAEDMEVKAKAAYRMTDAEFPFVQSVDALQFRLYRRLMQVGGPSPKTIVATTEVELSRALVKRHDAAAALTRERKKLGGRRRVPLPGY
jgi:hypothetical protein